jgi:hypothetical protein
MRVVGRGGRRRRRRAGGQEDGEDGTAGAALRAPFGLLLTLLLLLLVAPVSVLVAVAIVPRGLFLLLVLITNGSEIGRCVQRTGSSDLFVLRQLHIVYTLFTLVDSEHTVYSIYTL